MNQLFQFGKCRILFIMDILDQINANKSTNQIKKKTSILAQANQSPPRAKQYETLNILPLNQSVFKPKIDQRSSYQHLKLQHFQMPQTNSILRPTQSHKDAYSIKNKQNKIVGFSAINSSSLAVIASEQSSQTNKQITNVTNSRRIGRKETINSKIANSIQYEELLDKFKALQEQKKQLQQRLTQSIKNLNQKCLKILELQQKLQQQQKRNRQNYKQILSQQSEIVKTQIQTLTKTKDEQLNRKQSLIIWQNNKKQQNYKRQIQSLKNIIQNYKNLIQIQNEIQNNKKSLQFKKTKQNQDIILLKQKTNEQKRLIDKNRMNLQQKIEQYYKQKKQFNNINNQIKKKIDEERIKFNNQKIIFMKEFRQKQQKLNLQFQQKNKNYEDKFKKLQILTYELQIKHKLIQKQRQQMKRLNQVFFMQNKTNLQKLNSQKEEVFKLQKELIQKIQTVQMFAKKTIPSLNKSIHSNANGKQNQKPSQKIQTQQLKVIPNQKNMQIISKIDEKITDERKIDLQNYLINLRKGKMQSKTGSRTIYKLQNFYK